VVSQSREGYLRSYLKRVRVPLTVFGAMGVLAALRSESPGADVESLARSIGSAVGGVVAPQDIRWEPSEGAIDDAVSGRWALVLASAEPGAPRDVWRVRVRVSPEGRPVEIGEVRNLTATPLGDDHALVVRGSRAAFATHAFGQEQSVTVLDLDGEPPPGASFADRGMAFLTNVQQTGTGRGIGRVDVTLDQPAQAVGLSLGEAALAIELADEGNKRRRASLDLARGELIEGAVGMHAEPSRHLPKRFVHWAVDTVRAVPWIGPEPIAWLEEKVFAVRDAWNQLAFKAGGGGATAELAAGGDAKFEPPPSILDASEASADSGHWPPPNIHSIWKTPEAGEGVWEAPKMPWLKRAASDAPPAFLRAFVRPDEDRPYARVLLVAMDMRQLDLEMEAGVEDPKPLTGPHGPGRIPRDPKIYSRVGATFNGAFKTEHGNYGMMVHRRVLLPAQPGAASVVLLNDGRVGLGTWSTAKDASGIRGFAEPDVLSFRQNLDALLDNGRINPSGRSLWGYTLPGTGMQTERSGICVTAPGHLLYAWGDDVSATTLAKAMKMAGCTYGMHLDMNPHHTGFIFANVHDLKTRKYSTELLSPKMEISPDKYIEYAAKDFFYVLVHDPTPNLPGAGWKPDPGAQPAPTWMPGLWSAKDGEVELFDVEPGRAAFRVRAGTKEPDAKTGSAPAYELAEADAKRVLFALTLGVSGEKRPHGLATDGRLVLPFASDARRAALVARADGTLAIVAAAEASSVPAHFDAVELPLVLEEGKVLDIAAGAETTRGALGITPDGHVLVARATAASYAPLAEALKRVGCTQAVALDRGGGHARAGLFRAGTTSPPRARYDETTLYGMGVPMKPRGFRFEPEAEAAPPGPTKARATAKK
jgi:hypothetical protein